MDLTASSGTPPSAEPPHGLAVPIRDLKLTIAGSPLEATLAEFARELDAAGIRKVRPRFYLSTEWGVCEGTVAIAIPFYLARPELTAVHAERVGHVEGTSPADLLRYLRHEMGHVVNYAYRLFDTNQWRETFGPMDAPYVEEFRLEPFSRRYVRHLPGWYAQKHPDEDWSETFAVWMTPGLDWHADYADWPQALLKLQYCDRTMACLADRDPVVTADDLDEDVSVLTTSVEQFYDQAAGSAEPVPAGLDPALRALFEDHAPPTEQANRAQPAAALIGRLEPSLLADVYRWTGHFPERTRPLVDHLRRRAEVLRLVYDVDHEPAAIVAFTCFVTTLAMNHTQRGGYLDPA